MLSTRIQNLERISIAGAEQRKPANEEVKAMPEPTAADLIDSMATMARERCPADRINELERRIELARIELANDPPPVGITSALYLRPAFADLYDFLLARLTL